MLTRYRALAALWACGLLMRVSIATAGEPHDLQARRITTLPTLDGVLDDEAWSAGPQPLDVWMSYNPLRGQAEQLQTQVWVAYDDKAIYFAFKCLDP